MKVLLLDTKSSNPNHYICRSVYRALCRHDQVAAVRMCNYGNCVATAKQLSPDLFLAFDGEDLHETLCARVCELSGHSALWLTDDPYVHAANVRFASIFDTVFTNDSGSLAAYGAKGFHLPFAGDAMQRRAVREAGWRYDLFFLGSAWPNRVEYLRELIRLTKGEQRFKIGLATNPYLPPVELPLDPSEYSWKAANVQFCAFANESKATLLLHRTFATEGEARASTPGPRLFEAAIAGAAQISEGGVEEVSQYFEPGKEIVVVSSPEECADVLKRMSCDASYRNELARNAQKRAAAHHSYDHRIATLLRVIDERRASFPVWKSAARKTPPLKPLVLMVTHNAAVAPPFGGVEIYQRWLMRSLEEQYDFLVYAPQRVNGLVGAETMLCDSQGRVLRTFNHSGIPHLAAPVDKEREKSFSLVVQEFAPSVIHYQHLIEHTLSLPIVSKALGVPSLFTLHDFYAVCSRFNLIGYDNRYCRVADRGIGACDICLNACEGLRAGAQAARLARSYKAIANVDCIHIASTSSKAIVESVFGGRLPTEVELFGMPCMSEPRITYEEIPEGPLRVAIPGNLTAVKGADSLIHALNQVREEDLQFHVLGECEPAYREIFSALRLPNVTLHGGYDIEDLPQIYRGMTLSLHLSRWPETWCMAVDEAWQNHVIPVVTDVGAPPQRIKPEQTGFVVPYDDPAALVQLFRRLPRMRSRLAEMRRRIAAEPLETAAYHLERMRDVYGRLKKQANPAISGGRRVPHQYIDSDLCRFPLTSVPASWGSPHQGRQVFPSVTERVLSYYRVHGMRQTMRKILSKVAGN